MERETPNVFLGYKNMRYLAVKIYNTRLDKNGNPRVAIILMQKLHKKSQKRKEKHISKKKNILIVGGSVSGKSKYIKRIYDKAELIYSGHAKVKGKLFFDAVKPLSEWSSQKQVIEHYEISNEGKKWKSLPAHEKVNYLETYTRETRAVVVVDDACSCTGRKLAIVEDCVKASRRFILSAKSENDLATNLRTHVLRTEPEIVRLSAESSVDKTGYLLIGLAITLMGTGYYQIGSFLIVLRFLMFMPNGNKRK